MSVPSLLVWPITVSPARSISHPSSAIADAPNRDDITSSVQAELTKSFSSAAATAEAYPQYASQIRAAARESFLQGDEWAYAAGIVAILVGAALVFFRFPTRDRERELLAAYHAQDTAIPKTFSDDRRPEPGE